MLRATEGGQVSQRLRPGTPQRPQEDSEPENNQQNGNENQPTNQLRTITPTRVNPGRPDTNDYNNSTNSQPEPPPEPPPTPDYSLNNIPRNNRPTKKSRANILLASLNMNGRQSPQLQENNQISKWTAITRVIRQKQIGILCLQETHLNEQHVATINELYGHKITALTSSDPNRPSTSAGVAILINKEKIAAKTIKAYELIPGRALVASIKWHNDHTLTILNIYAPNAPQEHPPFWNTIKQKLNDLNINSIDIMNGDFNLIEDPIDRAPAHEDDHNAVQALREIRESLHLRDAWRHENPHTRSFTFTSNTRSMSRIDRIYAKWSLTNSLHDWETTSTAIPTDHKMILVRLVPPKTPFIGPGRWTLPLTLLSDKPLMERITQRGKQLQQTLENAPQHPQDPQVHWMQFKNDIADIIKRTGKKQISKISNKIKRLKEDITRQERSDNIDTDPEARLNIALLQRELEHLENKRYGNERAQSQAKWHEKGEKINKYWSKVNAPKRPRDIIYAIRDIETDRLTTKTSEMADIAKRYHNDLQSKDLLNPENPERKRAQQDVLAQIPETQKFNDPESPLHQKITQEQVETALRVSKNGTATGLDGIPYELWKTIHETHLRTEKDNRPSFNIVKCLTTVYNNIQTQGVKPETDFSIGWMCPLYKKKDRTKIENYRPITLLNTDYKIMTKVLATQLAQHACSLLHPNQTGFVPTRSIFDPIRLAETMCAYADYMEEDGIIVALDQEKAYDKIDHRYLLDTLRTYRLPDFFVRTVESLYKHARTGVMVNGVMSEMYQVTRGVRQGDPLSCLLFNLAIEPLAATIRNSPDLTGYSIPNTLDKVIVNMYADDTTVYLSKDDKYSTLETILSTWCKASGAKFNLEKTEIIPIGTKLHRDRIVQTRRLHPLDPPLQEGIRIAEDGHPTRILGSWIGNDLDQTQPWMTTIDKIKHSLDRWGSSHPTLDAKRLIVQMVVGGMTQFLTKAQGMPDQTLKTLTQTVRDFIWNGERSPPGLGMEQLYKPREDGGIDLLNLETRNHAIEIVWLKTYLSNEQWTRPTWAYVTDAIINCAQKKGIQNPDDITTFLTTMRPSGRQPRTGKKIPRPVIALLKSAQKWNLTFAPLKLSKSLKRQLPAWHHIGVPPRLYHKTKTKCLRTTHRAKRIRDLVKISKRTTDHNSTHHANRACVCRDCRKDRRRGCQNPHNCAALARDIIGYIEPKYDPQTAPPKDNLTLTHRRQEKNRSADLKKGDGITFNPSLTARGSLNECFRILGPNKLTSTQPAHRLQAPRVEPGEDALPITVYTDGSSINNGKLDAKCGAGIWFGNNNPNNKAIQVPGPDQSNQTGEIAAITVALQLARPTIPLTIISDSMYAINGLTKHLKSWEDAGWNGISNKCWFQRAAYELRTRTAPTIFQWVKGHDGTEGNEQADRLANEGARKAQPDHIDLEVPDDFNAQGAKLSEITQSTAYKLIANIKPRTYTRTTLMNLDITRHAVQSTTGTLETDKSIWKNIRNADIRRPVQTFLYKAINGALRVGNYWMNIPNYEQRAKCSRCNDPIESLDHILTECPSLERTIIWAAAQQLWPRDFGEWEQPTIGHLLGCGSLKPTNHNDAGRAPTQHDNGKARLRTILLAESAHLIWVIRCGRVIDNKQLTPNAILNMWEGKINTRLNIDRRRAKSKKPPGLKRKIESTWRSTLNAPDPPEDWATNLEVLVGIKLLRPPILYRGNQVAHRVPHPL